MYRTGLVNFEEDLQKKHPYATFTSNVIMDTIDQEDPNKKPFRCTMFLKQKGKPEVEAMKFKRGAKDRFGWGYFKILWINPKLK
jgi:hypothetical protein